MYRKFILVLSVLCAVFSMTPVFAEAKVVATVSGVPITEFEVSRQIDKIMPFRVSFHGKMSQEKKDTLHAEAVETLIERAYKVCYALEEGITVDDKLLDEALAKIKANFQTEAAFNDAVAAESVAGLRASLARQLIAAKAEAEQVDRKVKVSDAEVENYYNERKHTYFVPMQYRASHILIKVDPASNPEERVALQAKAADLLKKAKKGEDFYNLAYYNSDDRTKYVGGDLGLFHEGQTAKPFEDALKQLPIGGISELVKTRWGYHIVKLTEKYEPRQIPFSEIKLKVRSQLEKEQRDNIYQQWISSAKAKCQVEKHAE